MRDLVQLLRRDADATTSGPAATLWREAADEIERFRAQNKRLTDKLLKIAEQETYK